MNLRQGIGKGIRWTARVVGGLVIALVLVFAIGEGVDISSLLSTEIVMFAGLFIMLAGVVLTWWKALWGCLAIAVGYAAFALAEGGLRLDGPFVVFPAIVLLYAIAWLLERDGGTPLAKA